MAACFEIILLLWNCTIVIFLKLKKEAWQPVSGKLNHSLCQFFETSMFSSLRIEKDGGLRKWRSSVFGVSAVLSDMEINLEFFAKVKAIKLHCCLGSGFISDRNDIASTWIGGNKITRKIRWFFKLSSFGLLAGRLPHLSVCLTYQPPSSSVAVFKHQEKYWKSMC